MRTLQSWRYETWGDDAIFWIWDSLGHKSRWLGVLPEHSRELWELITGLSDRYRQSLTWREKAHWNLPEVSCNSKKHKWTPFRVDLL